MGHLLGINFYRKIPMNHNQFIKQDNLGTKVSFDDTGVAFAHKSDGELYKTYLLFATMNRQWLVNTGTTLTKFALKAHLPMVTQVLKDTLYKQFCGGEGIDECERAIKHLHQYGIGTILDYSVEGGETDEGFDRAEKEIIRTIAKSVGNAAIPFCVFKVTGLARFALLEKISAKETLTATEKAEYERVERRISNICETAYKNQTRIFVDAEETWIQDAIDTLTYDMMAKYNREKAIVFNTYQSYAVSSYQKLVEAHDLAKEKGIFLGVKLVRGAYMEKERLRAKEKGYADPIQPNKEASDKDFDKSLEFIVKNLERIAVCAASHNERSNYYLIKLMEANQITPQDQRIFFAQLYGMGDHISYNLASSGYNVAKYLPYGPVKMVMPYLFRRASENTSIAGQSSREYGLVSREIERRKRQKRQTKN